MEVLGTQIDVVISMVRALYTSAPEPAKVRYAFDRLIGQLLTNPYMAHDPDHAVILRDTATTLVRPSAGVDPVR